MTTATEAERPTMTGEQWSRLPRFAQRYIVQLETDADPSGTIRSEMQLRDQCEALEKRVTELIESNNAYIEKYRAIKLQHHGIREMVEGDM